MKSCQPCHFSFHVLLTLAGKRTWWRITRLCGHIGYETESKWLKVSFIHFLWQHSKSILLILCILNVLLHISLYFVHSLCLLNNYSGPKYSTEKKTQLKKNILIISSSYKKYFADRERCRNRLYRLFVKLCWVACGLWAQCTLAVCCVVIAAMLYFVARFIAG